MAMLLVKTNVGPSGIEGVGLFAAEFIPKGTRIWEYREEVDQRFDGAYLAQFKEDERERLLTYCYKNPVSGMYVLCGDDAKYINHGKEPNTEDLGFDDGILNGEGITIAARDILPGEEIISNYASFDADAREGII
jgi:SET domain-containing protein